MLNSHKYKSINDNLIKSNHMNWFGIIVSSVILINALLELCVPKYDVMGLFFIEFNNDKYVYDRILFKRIHIPTSLIIAALLLIFCFTYTYWILLICLIVVIALYYMVYFVVRKVKSDHNSKR